MEFQNQYLESLISNFRSFTVEGFNIFALASDNLPHLICVCPNKDVARAIQSLLTVTEKAKGLQALDAYITGNCYLVHRHMKLLPRNSCLLRTTKENST